MSPQTRLGGFKILTEAAWISLFGGEEAPRVPSKLCRLLALEKINILFLNCRRRADGWSLDLVVDAHDAVRAFSLARDRFRFALTKTGPCAILSLFPHKSNPEISGLLLSVLAATGVEPRAVAQSNSAISLIVNGTSANRVARALFEPFNFSAYRTPADWKLAQKGKESLYKEVVATYQEKSPKVYSLELQEGQRMLSTEVPFKDLGAVGAAFKTLAREHLLLTFLTCGASPASHSTCLDMCLQPNPAQDPTGIMERFIPGHRVAVVSPVSVFSMNGPHFARPVRNRKRTHQCIRRGRSTVLRVELLHRLAHRGHLRISHRSRHRRPE